MFIHLKKENNIYVVWGLGCAPVCGRGGNLHLTINQAPPGQKFNDSPTFKKTCMVNLLFATKKNVCSKTVSSVKLLTLFK